MSNNIVAQTPELVKVGTGSFFVIDPATDWRSCPDCGMIVDIGCDCPQCASPTAPYAPIEITWEACPDCGYVYDAGDGCPDCDGARLERIQKGRGRRPGHTFDFAPGDGGISDQDIDAGPTPEYRRMLAQETARRERIATKADTIPFMGEPVYAGSSWGGAADDYGLEARG